MTQDEFFLFNKDDGWDLNFWENCFGVWINKKKSVQEFPWQRQFEFLCLLCLSDSAKLVWTKNLFSSFFLEFFCLKSQLCLPKHKMGERKVTRLSKKQKK